jgi:phosphoglycolate phosphatase
MPLIVFDLDGTLVDSRRDLADAANAMLASYGVAPLGEDEVARMVGDGAAVLVGRLLERQRLAVPLPEALERFLHAYDTRLTAHTRPYDGIREAVAAAAAFAKLAVLTNKPVEQSLAILEALDLRDPFEWVIGGNSGFPRKPDPASLQYLATEARADPGQVVLVGDSIVDVRTARNAGTKLCVARYGFGFASIPRETLTPAESVVDHPAEIVDVVRRMVEA